MNQNIIEKNNILKNNIVACIHVQIMSNYILKILQEK